MSEQTDARKYSRLLSNRLQKILGRRHRQSFAWELFSTRPDGLITWSGLDSPGSDVLAVTSVTIDQRQYWVVGALKRVGEENLLGCFLLGGMLGALLAGATIYSEPYFILCDEDPRTAPTLFFDHSRRRRYFKDQKELNQHLTQ